MTPPGRKKKAFKRRHETEVLLLLRVIFIMALNVV